VNSEIGEQEFDPFAHDRGKDKPRKSSGGIAWLALLLAAAAAALSGYLWWLERASGAEDFGRQTAIQDLQRVQSGLEQSLREIESRLVLVEQDDGAAELSALKSGIEAAQGRAAEIAQRSADDRAAIEAIGTSLLGLDQRVAVAETGIAALAVRGDSPGKRMDLAEVEYLLRLASERLQLFGDPDSADRSLALADERLAALEDPLYLPVRQRIASSRRALAAIPVPDTVLLSERISNLQSGIPALPFPGERSAPKPVDETAADDGVWARFKRTMSGLVTVRRRVDQDARILGLEDRDYVRQGLWLQLESARLAVMRADAASWMLSLQRAGETLSSRFDRQAPQVGRAMAEVEALRQTQIVGERPDISAPWAQLRLLREGRVEPDDPPGAAGRETTETRPGGSKPETPAGPDAEFEEPAVDPGESAGDDAG
jgi:uroporphyrin-3 C-methyltransferase